MGSEKVGIDYVYFDSVPVFSPAPYQGMGFECIPIPATDSWGRPANDITFAEAADIEGLVVPDEMPNYFQALAMCNNNPDLVSIPDSNIPFKDYPGITYAPDFNGNGYIWSMIGPGPQNPSPTPSPTIDPNLPHAGEFQAIQATPYADNGLYSRTPNSGAFTESMGVALGAGVGLLLLGLAVYSRLKRK